MHCPCKPFAFLVLALAWLPSLALAQISECARIENDAARLACYDRLAGREPAAEERAASPPSELETRWQLRPQLKRGIFTLAPYKPVYLLIRGSTDPNRTPASPTRPFALAEPVDLDPFELKLQLSVKTKMIEDVFGSRGDLWFGYTQQSHWQAGNTALSSLFRETNYEPEVMFVHPLAYRFGEINARYAGVSLNHQSNGQVRAFSRSWNRLIGDLALESGAWSLQLRPWLRVFDEEGDDDDNPDIEDFIGRGELVLMRRLGVRAFTLTARHSLRSGARSRGSLRADWAFPLVGTVNAHLQIFSGYGESLIDYNHRQTTLGLGFSFVR